MQNNNNILACLLLLIANQFSAQTPLAHDPAKHFIYKVAFALAKDSVSNLPDTIFTRFKYQAITETKWNDVERKWETNSSFKTVQENYFTPDLLPRIDSVFFKEKYEIKAFSISIVYNGSEKFYDLKPPRLDQKMKEVLRNQGPECRVYFELRAVNQEKQEQKIVIVVKRKNSEGLQSVSR